MNRNTNNKPSTGHLTIFDMRDKLSSQFKEHLIGFCPRGYMSCCEWQIDNTRLRTWNILNIWLGLQQDPTRYTKPSTSIQYRAVAPAWVSIVYDYHIFFFRTAFSKKWFANSVCLSSPHVLMYGSVYTLTARWWLVGEQITMCQIRLPRCPHW